MSRKDPLVSGEIYHIMNKSIAGYTIFNSPIEYMRMKQILSYYSIEGQLIRFCFYLETQRVTGLGFDNCFINDFKERERRIKLLAYCIMPTHIHLVIQQLCDRGIETYMSNLSNSYTRYFNQRHARKGPLWVGRFKSVRVENDEQLLHLTRYVHLNPVSANLTRQAKDWEFSSFREYINNEKSDRDLCQIDNFLDRNSLVYERFVNDYADFQKELALIKSICLD